MLAVWGCDSCAAHTGRVRNLMKMFPKARFVYIHRDPYEVRCLLCSDALRMRCCSFAVAPFRSLELNQALWLLWIKEDFCMMCLYCVASPSRTHQLASRIWRDMGSTSGCSCSSLQRTWRTLTCGTAPCKFRRTSRSPSTFCGCTSSCTTFTSRWDSDLRLPFHAPLNVFSGGVLG